jgi:3-oxoacyl-[acyl-carrier-protein] synthase II
MSKQRVVITGLGVVSGIGLGVKQYGDALRRGDCAVSEISLFDTTGFASHNGCEVKGFESEQWVRNLEPKNLGRSSQFSIAAARMAIEDAGLTAQYLAKKRCGVSVGTTDGESQVIEKLAKQWVDGGYESCSPHLFRQVPANNISFSIAREFGLRGEAITIPTACAAGNYAIGHAFDRISVGDAEIMLCGGADSMCRKTFSGFYRLGTIAPEVCQPFDKNRKGILTGEGAGMLLLESLDSARQRGAAIYAEVLGYGMNCDAQHMVAPNKARIAACMRLAHANACVEAREIDWISAHGTGTQANDVTESGAILEVFGEKSPPTTSIKSMIGHTMGAASALASVACAIALTQRFIPPTINWTTPDPECGLDCVPNKAREAELRIVQNNGFAFGGNNCITVYGLTDACAELKR